MIHRDTTLIVVPPDKDAAAVLEEVERLREKNLREFRESRRAQAPKDAPRIG